MQFRVIGQADDTVHFVLLCYGEIFLLHPGIVVGGTQKHPIVSLHKGSVDVVYQLCKKRIGCVGDQQCNRISFAGFQALRVAVYMIVKFLDCCFHTKTVGFAYRQSVDHFGNCTQCNACLQCNVFHSRSGIFPAHDEHLISLFREIIIIQIHAFVKNNFMNFHKFHETLYEELIYKMLKFYLFNFHKNIRIDGFVL